MNKDLYNKKVTCPVCSQNFETTKVMKKACKVESRDTDFFIKYEGLNPMLYEVLVCENCGHAALEDRFLEINSKEIKIIANDIKGKWKKRSFVGERSIEKALEAFKLALYNLQLRNTKSSEFAKVCIRIAWLYRLKNDKTEIEFLKYALNFYKHAYENESFPAEKLDEFTCMYMIAELSRRVGMYEEAITWFNKLISNQEARKKPIIMNSAREQYHLTKEELNRQNGSIA